LDDIEHVLPVSKDTFLKKKLILNDRVEVKVMPKCAKCGKGINIFTMITDHSPDGTKIIVCENCKSLYTEEEKRQQLKEIIANATKIKCPYCEQCFPKLTNQQYRDGAELNILKWVIVPSWGVFANILQGIPYIECPHCKMKIPQR
jgi:DNA-directed RNA polymerase subunit RPC12/RpoP